MWATKKNWVLMVPLKKQKILPKKEKKLFVQGVKVQIIKRKKISFGREKRNQNKEGYEE